MVFLPDKKKRKVKKTKKTKAKPKQQSINITIKQPRYEQSSRQQQQLPREQTIYNNTQLAQQYSFLQSLIDNVRKPSPLEQVKDTPPAQTSTALIVREPSQPLTESAQNDNTLLKQKIFEERRQKKMFEEQQAMIKLREQQLKKQLLKEDTKPTLKERYKKPVDMKPPTTPPKPTQILKQEPKLSLAEEHDAKLLKDLREGKTYLQLVEDSDDEPPKKQKTPTKKTPTKKTPIKKDPSLQDDDETDDEGDEIIADVVYNPKNTVAKKEYDEKERKKAKEYYITKHGLPKDTSISRLGRDADLRSKIPKHLLPPLQAKADVVVQILKDQKLI
jgi:hypothetical protein